jgi:hypothetical protein
LCEVNKGGYGCQIINKSFVKSLRAWKDEDFKQKFISDPKGTLAKADMAFPADIKVKVHFNPPDTAVRPNTMGAGKMRGTNLAQAILWIDDEKWKAEREGNKPSKKS